ncbi:hypothetical protein J3R82DRAFT_9162 [Butyriboletus roseoflavus]|nr:hypothetical protein J3R82DRAFT_9162 [Butyriboletus roseoflavus]
MLKVSESLALNTSLMLILYVFFVYKCCLAGMIDSHLAQNRWRLGIYSWSASRLVLNLRETASRHTNMGTTTMSMLGTDHDNAGVYSESYVDAKPGFGGITNGM